MEGDLQQQVPQLLAKGVVVLPLQGVQHLISFLNEGAPEGEMGLFRIPGAAAGAPEAGHYRHQVVHAFAGQLAGLGRG